MSSDASIANLDQETFPEDALPMPLEIPAPLPTISWAPISIYGWMFYPGAAEEINGQPYVAGWLFEKGVALAWVLATYPNPDKAVALHALVEWVGDGESIYGRLQVGAVKWLNSWSVPPINTIYSSFVPEKLKETNEQDPKAIADGFLVYLAHRSLEEIEAEHQALKASQTS